MSETFDYGFLRFGSLDLGLYGKYILVVTGIVSLLLLLPLLTRDSTDDEGSKKKASTTTPAKKSPGRTGRKSKGKEELGTIFSPEGRRSTRNRK